MDFGRLNKIVGQYAGKKVMVLGDFVADEYILGQPSRISREAPVLILKLTGRKTVLGGAGNAAKNLSTMGATVIPVGVVGDDDAGREIVRQLQKLGIDTTTLFIEKGHATTTKTRIMAGGLHTSQQQLVRLDHSEDASFPDSVGTAVMKAVNNKIAGVDGLIVSDYQCGTLSPRMIEEINKIRGSGLIVCVDSRYRMMAFKGVTAVTPNEPEVEEALGVRMDDREDTVRQAGERILKQVQCKAVLVTRGQKGMALIESNGKAEFIPIVGTDEVTDVTGAGDTVIVNFTLALASGASFLEAAQLSNVAGGIVVMKQGTASVAREELLQSLKAL